MGRYTLAHSYSANHNGRRFGPWLPGDEVEMDDADAEWVNRDSPGALAPVGAVPVAVEPDAEDTNEGGEEETPAEPDSVEDPEPVEDAPPAEAPAKPTRRRSTK